MTALVPETFVQGARPRNALAATAVRIGSLHADGVVYPQISVRGNLIGTDTLDSYTVVFSTLSGLDAMMESLRDLRELASGEKGGDPWGEASETTPQSSND